MPLDTHVAGDPGQLRDLGDALTQTLGNALEHQREALAGPRRAYTDVWQGPAGEELADTAANRLKEVDHLLEALSDVGTAVSTFGDRLHDVQSRMENARMAAPGHGLTVSGHLIEDVAPMVPMTYSSEGPVPASVTRALEAHQARVTAYLALAEEVEHAVSLYVEACRDLTDAIGETVDQGWLADLVLAAAPGTLSYLGDDVLWPLSQRLGRSRAISDLLQGLDGDEMGDLVRHLFASINGLDDRSVVAALADLSNKSGGAVDRYLIVAGILSGLHAGEGLEQAIVSEGAGWATGTLATAGTYAAAGATGGTFAGPVGTAVAGGIALVVGVGVGMYTSAQVDEWYDDAAFEDLIRHGLAEQ